MKTDLFATTLAATLKTRLRAFDGDENKHDTNVQIPEWFANMSKEHQEAYLKEHPDSKYAGKAKSHDEDHGSGEPKPAAEKKPAAPAAKPAAHGGDVSSDKHATAEIAKTVAHLPDADKAAFTPEAMKGGSKLRAKLANGIKSHAKAFYDNMKKDVHEWKHAAKAVHKLAKGGTLTHEDKEAIKSTALEIGVITGSLLLTGGAAHGAVVLAHHVATHAANEFLLKAAGRTLLHVHGGSLAITAAKGADDKLLEELIQHIIEQIQSGKIPPEVAKAAAQDAAKGKGKAK